MTDYQQARTEAQRLRLVAIHEAQQAAKVREALEKWSSLAHLRP